MGTAILQKVLVIILFTISFQVRKREALFDAQKKLEDQMRKEEDELLMSFQKERKAENQRLSQEIEEEWEKQLVELTKKFNDKSRKKMADIDKKVSTVKKKKSMTLVKI